VIMPSTAEDAKGLLLSSIFDENPVIFLEHRWLHNQKGYVPEGDYRIPLGKVKIVKSGTDVTIVSMSYMTIEALRAANYLERHKISCELIDLRTVSPIDWEGIYSSVRKTGRLLVLDTGTITGSISGEIVARIAVNLFSDLRCAPQRIALPDVPTPSSPALTENFYPGSDTIAERVAQMMNIDVDTSKLAESNTPHDIPGDWFKGPF